MTEALRLVSTAALLSAIMACVSAGEEQRRPSDNADDAARVAERDRMVDTQIRARGVADERVLAAMRRVPRHRFVPEEHQARAYDDTPLPIGFDQTISQPYIVAYMSEVLDTRSDRPRARDRHRVRLSGGHPRDLVRDVYTIEIVGAACDSRPRDLGGARVHERARSSRQRLPRLARGRTVRQDHRHRGSRRSAAGRWSISSPPAA